MILNFKTLYLALRPWSLPASVCPVILGAAMAFGDQRGDGLAAVLAVCVAVLIHLGTNVVNDIGDFRSGVDAANPGATYNVILEGIVSEKMMIRMAVGFFCSAAVLGFLAVVMQKAWILLGLGAISIVAGIVYTAGPKPAAYLGLGDLFVIVFFGPVAAAGTYYLQALTVTWPVVLAGLGCGLICNGILVVNNYRDYEGDRRTRKKTLAVRFGRTFAQWEYMLMFFMAGIISISVFLLTGEKGVLLSLVAVIAAIPAIFIVFQTREIAHLNRVLAGTGKILLCYSLLFCAGWVLF